MKSTKLLLLFLPVVLLAQDSSKKPAKPAPKTAAMTVPADAVKIGPYAWRYVDKDGKAWIYRYTMTGLAKVPDSDGDPTYAGVKVTDKGDTFRFERPGVMGVAIWERKKSDLTEEEKAMVEFSKSKAEPGKTAAQPEKK